MNHSRGGRVRRLSMRCAVLFAGVLAAGALAHTAQASTLAGETFTSGFPAFGPVDAASVSCGATPTDPFTYHVDGTASGPHSGVFFEDGRVVPNALGQIVSLDVTFGVRELFFGEVTVTGEKHFLGPPGGTAFCEPDGLWRVETDQLCYRAEFADGSRDETGRSTLDFRRISLPPPFPPFTFSFRETFIPDATVSCGGCPDDDDGDGDGLSDSRESRFLTLLGNDDSDRDGIADGNDDANGNGEDDEDEDDDEDDGCPDEDSDDDGEDDEDEDDDEDDD
jgi:hypothetical protein